jgi:hypothetical protein
MDDDEDNLDSDEPDSLTSEPEMDFELGEEDERLAFDEGDEQQDCANREEMIQGLEQMLNTEDVADLWDICTCQKI